MPEQEEKVETFEIKINISVNIAHNAFDNACEQDFLGWMRSDAESLEITRETDTSKDRYYASAKFKLEGKDYTVTPKSMQECLGAFLEKYPHFAENYVGEYDGDAVSDDAWFQFAALGDIVYG